MQWNAKSKIGSLDNAAYKPGGGDKKIESLKMDFKDKAKSKVGSKDNVKHQPGGGDIKVSQEALAASFLSFRFEVGVLTLIGSYPYDFCTLPSS